MSEFLADINAFYLTDKNLCACGYCNACELSNLCSGLTYNLCIESAVDDDCLSYLFDFSRLEELTASCCEFTLYCIIDCLKNDN